MQLVHSSLPLHLMSGDLCYVFAALGIQGPAAEAAAQSADDAAAELLQAQLDDIQDQRARLSEVASKQLAQSQDRLQSYRERFSDALGVVRKVASVRSPVCAVSLNCVLLGCRRWMA